MRISRDTFRARCRAALGEIEQSDDPRYLFEWLAALERLLAKPQADSKPPDEPTRIPRGQGLAMAYAGAEWLVGNGKKLSPLGRTVADALGYVWRGLYHLPDTAIAAAEWGDNRCISVWIHGDVATFDSGYLTALVVVCHDLGLRMAVDPHGPGRLKLTFWQRTTRDTRLCERMPTLDQHVEAIRSGYRVLGPEESDAAE